MFRILVLVLMTILISVNPTFAKDDFYSYIKQVKLETEKIWNPPVYYQIHTSEVYFRINRDGSISNIKLAKSSKVSQLDKRAIETIKKLPKFNKLPEFYIGDYIEITVALTNYVYSDLRNPNIYQNKNIIKHNNMMPVNTKKVKIVKVLYPEFFYNGDSNFEDNMKKMVLNLDIQKSVRNGRK